MLNRQNVEIIYDAIDGYATIVYDHAKTPYLQGVSEACAAILAGGVDPDLPAAIRRKAALALRSVMGAEYRKEEVRKALQLCILKGFKHVHRPNSDMTPDTIGIFTAHLIGKLMPGNGPLVLFDPLVGTGNLLVAVADQLDRETKLYGVERDLTSYKLAESMFRMTDAGDDVFCQDTLTFQGLAADAVVTDFPPSAPTADGKYFPYEVIGHHRRNLKPDGWFIGLVADDFFTIPGADAFRAVIKDQWNVCGFVKLPDSMFKGAGKNFLILQNALGGAKAPAKVLLAELPSFEDAEAAAAAIRAIDLWFSNNPR